MRIAYLGPYLSTTPGSAALQRAIGIGSSLAACGHQVEIGTGDVDSVPAAVGPLPVGIGISHIRSRTRSSGRFAKALQWWTFADDAISWLTQLGELDAIVVYGGGGHLSRRIQGWAFDRGLSVVADQVEWYDPKHQPLGSLGPFARDLERGMNVDYGRSKNCITISTLLNDHFSAQGCRTLIVPPTTDVLSLPWSERTDNSGLLRLVYAGSPGRKDDLRTVVAGLELADPEGVRVRLDVYGPSLESLPSLIGRKELPQFVRSHGRVTREAVLEAVRCADFVPLIRPLERFANAGFPTKVVESMSGGTPVICNATSDLSRHVRDGDTGYRIQDPSPEAFAGAVQQAMAASPTDRRDMRFHARKEAEASFDFRQHSDAIGVFFSNLSPLC